MKFTSEDLLKAMGLKENDVIMLETGDMFKVVLNPMHINHDGTTYTQDTYELEFKDSTVRMPIMILLNNSYTIIQHKPTLTEDEKVILRNVRNDYKWLVRNQICVLMFFRSKPYKDEEYMKHQWIGGTYETSKILSNLFQFIKWEDEPYSIEELLKD